MATKRSAGLLLHRIDSGVLEVFLVHPGGPFWRNKDAGAWSIPKGELDEGEDPLAAARREFTEETGLVATGPFVSLTPVRQAGGKIVLAWSAAADFAAEAVRSNTFTMEWPPRSGRMQSFPEVDRAAWFATDVALVKLLAGQRPLVVELVQRLGTHPQRDPNGGGTR